MFQTKMTLSATQDLRNDVSDIAGKRVGWRTRAQKVSSSMKSFYKNATTREEMLPLAGFDAIFMRAEPPLDPLMLNFLDSVKNDVFIVNSLQGMREANNKLYTAAFEDPTNEIIPVTHVSKNKNYLIRMIEEDMA